MGKLVQIGNIIIRVMRTIIWPSHFHILTPDGDALVDIATLEILRGKLARKAQDTALEWAAKNKAAIAAEWNRTNPRFPIA